MSLFIIFPKQKDAKRGRGIFKFLLVGSHANKTIAIRFGVPAFFAALLGAYLLLQLSDVQSAYMYSVGGRSLVATPVKIIVATLLIFFALMEVVPGLKDMQPVKNSLFVGGLLSGFFGGLSGNQGAFRSAFLVKADLSKESFIATGVVIACIVDISRLGVYSTRYLESGLSENITLVVTATLSAFVGAFAGSRLLKKITMESIRIVIVAMLITLSIALGLGLI